jgi:hypothetical protein
MVLTFPNLAAGEHFTLPMLDTIGKVQALLGARSKSGLNKPVTVAPIRVFPKCFNLPAHGFTAFGFSSSLWFIIQPLL